MNKAVKCDDGKKRCKWSTIAPEFIDYHDKEWGYPVTDDIRLFEKICLESFQSGLSWRTILAKRENFRKAFKGFDFNKVARFKDKDIEKLLANEGIVRHRGKILATINNAQKAKEVVKEFGSLSDYFWSFESKTSDVLSKDLKKRGWKFVGPTTVYAFMQAMGLVNDHAKDCCVYKKVEKSRKEYL
jgi:DNA-3-methyladenine glycosylase I